MGGIKTNHKVCKKCGRKIPKGRQSEYCTNMCENSIVTVRRLSTDLLKEIYMLISNEGLFSDEELGRKLKSKKFIDKFSQVLFIQDKDIGDRK